jgi:hypothetical protein
MSRHQYQSDVLGLLSGPIHAGVSVRPSRTSIVTFPMQAHPQTDAIEVE